MKKLIVFALIISNSLGMRAGDIKENLEHQVECGMGFPLPESVNRLGSLQYQLNYTFGNNLSGGIGTGMAFYDKTLIPLYGAMRWNMTSPHRFTPFLEGRYGYSFAPSSSAMGGTSWEVMLGVAYKIGSSQSVLVSIGCRSQEYHQVKEFDSQVIFSRYEEKISHQALVLRVGYRF